MTKNKILITGGCGYIGSHTAVDLLNKGYEVISIDNLSRSKSFIPDRIREITGKEFQNYKVDCRDLPKIRNIISSHPDLIGIIHFAAFKSVNESMKNPLIYFDNNLKSTINLLRITDEFEIPYFVFSSSCSVYGNTTVLPVNELTPVETPESTYGWTKLIGEQMIEANARVSKSKYISLRYFNPVGAHESNLLGEIPYGNPENLVPNITQTAIGKRPSFTVHGNDYPTRDGSCVRDYLHVMDIAEAHTAALQYLADCNQEKNYDIINLGSGEGVTVLELIRSFEKVSGVKLNYVIGPRREGDVVAIYADNTKAQHLLNWNCKRDIDDMMRTAWNWELEMQRDNLN